MINPFDLFPNKGEKQKRQLWASIQKHPFIFGFIFVIAGFGLVFWHLYSQTDRKIDAAISSSSSSVFGSSNSQTVLYAIGPGAAIQVVPSVAGDNNRPTSFTGFTLFAPQSDIGIAANSRVDTNNLEIIAGKNGIQTGNNSPVNPKDTIIQAGKNGIQTGDRSPVAPLRTKIQAGENGVITGNHSPIIAPRN